jgi:hypothetical protein
MRMVKCIVYLQTNEDFESIEDDLINVGKDVVMVDSFEEWNEEDQLDVGGYKVD